MSWYDPQPKDAPVRLPRREPIRVVPSYIGEENQILNLLMYRGAGDVARDYSGQDYDGEINGAKWDDEKSASWTLYFDGSDDWVDCGSDVTDDLTAFTMIYWIMAESWTGDSNAANRGEYQVYHRFWNTNAGNRGLWIGDGSAWDVNVTDTVEPSLGTWYMCTLRWDGATFELLYNDADLQLSVDTTISSTGSNTYVFALAHSTEYGEWLHGRESNVLLYTDALSDAKISSVYEHTKPLFAK